MRMPMKRTRRSLVEALLVAGLVVCVAGPAGAASTVKGRITDSAGRPLADVAVTLSNDIRGLSYSAKTDSTGTYSLPGVVAADYRLRFAKEGYESMQGIVSVVGGKANVFDAALKTLTGKPAPPPWEEKNLRARDLYVQKKYADALILYREILAADPKVAFIHFDAGNCSYHLQDYEAAVGSYREAVRLKPDFSEAYTNLANAYSRLKKFDEAIPFFEAAIRSSPATGSLFYGLGVLYLNSGQAAKAVPCLEKFVTLEPKNPSGYYSLGAACAEAGDLARAVESYGTYVSLISDEREIERVRGIIEDLKSRIRK
jgi:tetratricopeptide (TPR) repeat protein